MSGVLGQVLVRSLITHAVSAQWHIQKNYGFCDLLGFHARKWQSGHGILTRWDRQGEPVVTSQHNVIQTGDKLAYQVADSVGIV